MVASSPASSPLRIVDQPPSTDSPHVPAPTIIVMNVGTPDAPTTSAVRRYLKQFLSDPRVLDIAALGRWLLLRLIILPFRSPKSARMYRTIWTERGSPLLVHTLALADKLRARLPNARVLVGMRYGKPSIDDAVAELHKSGATRVILAPMFPQYASASTGTAVAEAFRLLGQLPRVPEVTVMPPFFVDEGFVKSVAATVRDALAGKRVDHLLFSYHSIPLHQVQGIHTNCVGNDACCVPLGPHNASCYRAQCLATTSAVLKHLDAVPSSNSFQSRLGRAVWLGPNTELAIDGLAKAGVKRLAIVCPSFVSDCLETLEEIGVRAKEQFLAAGGEELIAIPCVNADDRFADAYASLLERHASL